MNLRAQSLGLAMVLSLVFVVGCAHTNKDAPLGEDARAPKEIPSFRVSDPEPPAVVDQELESIPVEINERVELWLGYFQGKGRRHMERYLARSTRYLQLMKRIMKQNGLPEDLVYIALIESGFSSRATSRAAAVGYWQFIRGTGKRYGLEINSLVDERRDPVLSTQAAAEYFKGLYSAFGSWYLAMASYNVGENRVKREVMKHYTRDFWELARKRRFPRETINYVPKYIAAKLIAKDPKKYGFTDIEYEKPIEFELIKIDKALNLRTMASKLGIDYADLKLLNPKFRGEIAPTKRNGLLEIRVPSGQTQVALQAAKESIVEKVELIADSGETETYRVKRGDSLYIIARKYRTTVAWLRDTNDLKPGKKLRIGMRLQVPERGATRKPVRTAKPAIAKREDVEQATTNAEIVSPKGVYYIVQPGDTLSAIADEYDSTVRELQRMNSLGKGQVLRVGMRLLVPKDEALPSEVEAARRQPGSNVNPFTGISHVVRRGENLSTIAKRYGVSIQDIKKANNLRTRSVIRVGLRLIIPTQAKGSSGSEGAQQSKSSKKIHVVKKGENLALIAGKYDVSMSSLISRNGISGGGKILVGAKLIIPNEKVD